MPFNTKNTDMSRQGMLWRRVIFIALLSLPVSPLWLPADEAFAPWVEFTPEGKSALQQQALPTKTEVGIPACPNGYIVSISSMENKQGGGTIPVIHLVSRDDVETVRNFYKTELLKQPGWKWDDIFEAFYFGESYEEALAQLNPYMEITAVALDSDRLKYVEPSLKQTLKSWIQIVCGPKK